MKRYAALSSQGRKRRRVERWQKNCIATNCGCEIESAHDDPDAQEEI